MVICKSIRRLRTMYPMLHMKRWDHCWFALEKVSKGKKMRSVHMFSHTLSMEQLADAILPKSHAVWCSEWRKSPPFFLWNQVSAILFLLQNKYVLWIQLMKDLITHLNCPGFWSWFTCGREPTDAEVSWSNNQPGELGWKLQHVLFSDLRLKVSVEATFSNRLLDLKK